MDALMTTADCFFGRFFTNIKVKKLGDVNVINPNSDDGTRTISAIFKNVQSRLFEI